MPNVRRAVLPGDWIFVVSGRMPSVQQYVVGGFQVDQKLSAFAAHAAFPENRLSKRPDGSLAGNIIVNGQGRQHPLDYHSGFEKRVNNYIVGRDPIVVESPAAVARCRLDTLPFLEDLFDRSGASVFDVIGRWRRLDEHRIDMLLSWLNDVKSAR